jgi:hypothetical protein
VTTSKKVKEYRFKINMTSKVESWKIKEVKVK